VERGGKGFSREAREGQVTDEVRPVRRGEVSDAAAALTLTRSRGQFTRFVETSMMH
jgi:hypothetical protein